MYDLDGKLLTTRLWSCLGCGAKHMPKDTPACLRKANKNGDIVRKNPSFEKIEKRVK
jgi:hypothetical protein